MAFLLPAAFSSLFASGAGTAVGAGGAALGAGASTLSLGSLFTTILSGGATALSAMAAINGGKEQAMAYRAEANQADFQQQEEVNQGRIRRDSMRKDLIKQLGEQDVAYASSGLDLSFGSPVAARDESKADAARALSTDLNNEVLKRNQLQQRRDSLRRMALDASKAGRAKALGLALDFGVDAFNRGIFEKTPTDKAA